MNNTNAAPVPPFTRPGISGNMLARCMVRAIDAKEAQEVFGHPYEGLLLPYLDLDGNPILDGGASYFRDRLAKPIGDMKYFQKRGTIPHAYLAPGLKEFPPGAPLIIVEGEFKAMSLVEAGYPAVGIGGFYGYAWSVDKENRKIVAELKAAIDLLKPSRLYFLGDSDTSTNYQFSDAAIKLARMVSPIPVLLPRIPANGPGKGADDCRETLGGQFAEWFNTLLKEAEPVGAVCSNADLALLLLQRDAPAIASLRGADRLKAQDRLIKMAAYLAKSPLQQDGVISMICQSFALNRSAVKSAIKLAREVIIAEVKGSRHHGKGVRPHGRKPGASPNRIIYLPCQQFLPNSSQFTSITDTASKMFPLFASTGLHFQRSGIMCTVERDPQGFLLSNISAAAFRTEAEKLNALLMRHVMPFGSIFPQLVQSILKEGEATALLASREAKSLPPIVGLSSCPVIVPDEQGGFRIVESGYDAETHIYVTPSHKLPPLPPIDAARDTLLSLLEDFRWQSRSDKSRALAMLLTPALKMGKCIDGLTPIFMAEADKSQAGKGYLFDVIAAMYDQPLTLVPQHPGKGVGSTEEGFHRALSRGYPFIVFDNWRGEFDCSALEEFLTNRQKRFDVRLPFEKYITVDPSFYVIGLTSNGLKLKEDQGNRTALIRLLKQPEDYQFRSYAEGELLMHVRKNWPNYLAAAYSIIKEWGRLERPRTSIRFDSFTNWAQCLDWIVQNLFNHPPLLTGLSEQKARLSDPIRMFARDLALLLANKELLDTAHTSTELANIACLNGLKIPSLDGFVSPEVVASAFGITMKALFRKGQEAVDEIEVDGFIIERSKLSTPRRDGAGGAYSTMHYMFSKRQE